ncbi:MAG: SMI1/KNR4 family protein, partial [Peptococcaceae bacterium]|nr:SMI1/KNR4 family protein [Peptococcaceae bacterium]
GVPYATCYVLPEGADDEADYIEITGFLSIGRKKENSLCGLAGNKLFKEGWHYPDYGVYICDCPSAGFDLILLDYRACGPDGEPGVAYVNIEENQIIPLAPDFATFVQNLVEENELISPEEDRAYEIQIAEEGEFSPLLIKICRNCGVPQAEQWFRSVARELVEQKGYFGTHEDPLSWLMYDLQYMLYSFAFPKASVKQYLHDYPLILAEDGEFSTNGYAPAFVADWMEARIQEGKLTRAGSMIGQKNCMIFTTESMEQIVLQCKEIAEKYDL